jgi:4-coumarate--CoA ligase
LNPNVFAKIIDNDGKNVTAYNTPGEILLKGPSTFQGYHEVDNSDTFDHDGFYQTGDIGYCDEDGKWWIIDRKKELLKVRGFQVAPPEGMRSQLCQTNLTGLSL